MRKLSILFACMLMASMLYSQSLKDITLSFGGGLSVPMSDNNVTKYFSTTTRYKFVDCWNNGFNLTAGLGYIVTPELTAFVTVDYSAFTINKGMVLKQLRLPSGTYVQDGEFTTVAAKIGARYYVPVSVMPKVLPYVTGSIGIMNLASDDIYVLIDAYTNYKARFVNSNVASGSFAVGFDIVGGESSAMFVQLGVDVANTKGGALFYLPLTIGFRGGL